MYEGLIVRISGFMRKIHLIVIHCSATRADKELTAFDLDTMHRRDRLSLRDPQGWNNASYPSGGTDRGTCERFSCGEYRNLLRRRSGLPGTPGGHTDTGTAGSAPAAGASVAREIPRLPGVRSSRLVAGSHR